MLHPQAVAAAELWAFGPSPGDTDFDIGARRAEAVRAAQRDAREPVETVRDVDADRVACRLYRPGSPVGLLLGIHGGGFVLGELDTHDAHWRRVANRTRWAVLAVDYRRAPEHRYPAASDDVDAALAWARRNGAALRVDTSRIAVVGDSAGGQLALVAALRCRALAAVALVYPCVDPSGSQPSYHAETGGLTAREMDWYWACYLNGQTPPELDLLGADLSGLPPTFVLTAEHDPLRDEGELLASRIAESGVPSCATRFLGMIHGFWRWPQLFDASDIAVGQLAAFLDGVTRRP